MILLLGQPLRVLAQLGMGGTPHPSAVLDLKSPANDKGFLMPRLTTAQRLALPNAAPGLLVYDLDKATLVLYDGQSWLPLATTNFDNLYPIGRVASDGAADDNFGNSVAISGDYAIVGASSGNIGNNEDQGSVYVFVRSGNTWTQQAKLTASDGAAFDYFGSSVAISGDYAIIGTYYDDIDGKVDQGSAYVFVRSGNTWTQQTKLTASNGAAFDYFGSSVAISGDYALVGSPTDDNLGNQNQGSAYVFVRSGNTWTQQAKITASDGGAGDYLGYSVGISGNYAIVGAYTDDIDGKVSQGSAYVFVRSGNTWTQQAKLTAFVGAASDNFGWSVAISGDYAIVGAYGADINNKQDQGAAYVFVRTNNTWTQQAKLTASDGVAGDKLGVSVAISGDYALAGAGAADVGGKVDQGSAYVFVRTGNTWPQQAKLVASDGATEDYFGARVAISGDYAIVGSPFDNLINEDQGSAYVFARTNNTWPQQAKLVASDGTGNDNFGYSVAISGDYAIVGAYTDIINNNQSRGSAYVFVRSGNTWTQQAKLIASDGAAYDYFGISVAISGDYAIVGAYLHNPGGVANQGAAYLFRRTDNNWLMIRKVTDNSPTQTQNGRSIGISNGTFIIGGPGFESNKGKVSFGTVD